MESSYRRLNTQKIFLNHIGGCCTASRFRVSLLFLLSVSLVASAFLSQAALAKRVPMGHPSLTLSLTPGSDPRFDFIVMDSEETIETLKDDVNARLYGIASTIILPEIRKSFEEKRNILSDSYVEHVSGYYDLSSSMLDILISKVPPDYDCNTESCAHRFAEIDVPSDLELSHIRKIYFSIAVFENMDRDSGYNQMVDLTIRKASVEAEVMLTEIANVLEENKEALLNDGTAVERILLRQYEDISRISVIFRQSEPGVNKKPLDVVITSNSYYERSWTYYLTGSSDDQLTTEMLDECERAGIDEADCSEIAILQARRNQLPKSDDAIDQNNSFVADSIAWIGIGAAGAGIAAIISHVS